MSSASRVRRRARAQLYAGSAAYSSLCILPDHSVGVLFEKDNYTRITFARVEEAWLMNPEQDADADGMPDAWELLHGLSPASSGSEADSDGDGTSDPQEYAAGTDPLEPSSLLRIARFATQGGNILEWNSIPGRSYAIEESPDVFEWTPIPDFALRTATGPLSSAALPQVSGERRFYRVRVLE